MAKNRVAQILDFMSSVEKLCLVNRDNKMSEGRPETDSDHIFKLCYWIMLIKPYLKTKVDYTKMFELALVHDLAEAVTGDISLSSQLKDPSLKAQKKAAEEKAMEKLKQKLPAELSDRVYELFMEYETKSTPESKIVYALDKLDAHWQANQFNDGDIRYWADCDGGDIYYKIALEKRAPIQEAGEDIVRELEDAMIEISKNNMQKCGIKNV